jgi:hypothetical protein
MGSQGREEETGNSGTVLTRTPVPNRQVNRV